MGTLQWIGMLVVVASAALFWMLARSAHRSDAKAYALLGLIGLGGLCLILNHTGPDVGLLGWFLIVCALIFGALRALQPQASHR